MPKSKGPVKYSQRYPGNEMTCSLLKGILSIKWKVSWLSFTKTKGSKPVYSIWSHLEGQLGKFKWGIFIIFAGMIMLLRLYRRMSLFLRIYDFQKIQKKSRGRTLTMDESRNMARGHSLYMSLSFSAGLKSLRIKTWEKTSGEQWLVVFIFKAALSSGSSLCSCHTFKHLCSQTACAQCCHLQ